MPTDPRDAESRQPVLTLPPAYEALRPFFDRATQWGHSGQEHLALRTLSNHFPELNAQERFLIVITAKRLFRDAQDLSPLLGT